MRRGAIWVAQVLLVALWTRCAYLGDSARGVLEGDTKVELYINGFYIYQDPVMPVLLLNGERRFNVESDGGAWAAKYPNKLMENDIVALRALTSRPTSIPIKELDHSIKEYPGIAGVIAAFDDGTITSSAWRCTESIEEKFEDTWHSSSYNDSHWPYAIEQPLDCCPWRDPWRKWKRLSARWISPPRDTPHGPRSFFCRYRISGSTTRLMDGSHVNASSDAPRVSITHMGLSKGASVVYLDLGGQATIVSCGIIDSRFELRPPSQVELQHFGTTAFFGRMIDITGDNFNSIYDTPALTLLDVATVTECETECISSANCSAMSFQEVGSNTSNPLSVNCKLFANIEGVDFKPADSRISRFRHMKRRQSQPKLALTDTLLLPGTLYNGYCMATDPSTGIHSTWSDLAATLATGRTAGRFATVGIPEALVLGGWATNDSITAIVRSSIAGRVVCAARLSGLQPMSVEEVTEVGNYELIIVDGADAPVSITGLNSSSKYDVSCIAESENGDASSEDNLQEIRRQWSTESSAKSIEAMTLRHKPVGPELAIETIIRLYEQGLLWCQVYNSSYLQEHGVPDATMLESEGLPQEVEDSRVEALGMYPGLDASLTHEVYCTARYVDLAALHLNASQMQRAGPQARIVRADVRYDEAHLKVSVANGPGRVYCLARPWSVRPNSERPAVPRAKLMTKSPFTFAIESLETQIAALTITDLATGSFNDLYCYAEEFAPEPPPGTEAPPVRGMSLEAVRQRRVLVRTAGPEFKEDGWHCVAGDPCSISGLKGRGLSPNDQVIARSKGCPGRCGCNGLEDLHGKGAECSSVSHSRFVNQPDWAMNDLVDDVDPRGPWCYVNPGACFDEEPDKTFPTRLISYFACTFDELAFREGGGPSGFLNEGLAVQVPSSEVEAADSSLTENDVQVHSDEDYLATFQAIGCPNTFTLLTVSWKTQPDDVVLADMYSYCMLTKTGSASSVQAAHCCGATSCDVGVCTEQPEIIQVSPKPFRDGTAFSWGPKPLMVPGAGYDLCWCNGTTSSCIYERDFRLRIGLLHISGPTEKQRGALSKCVSGLPCMLKHFGGHAVAEGNRLAVVPRTSLGCKWEKPNPYAIPGVAGFPNLGISGPALDGGRVYSWGSEPVLAAGGIYILCWCGALNSTFDADCPEVRPDGGQGFLAPAGQLQVVGPSAVRNVVCRVGVECVIKDVAGSGIQGGDRVAVLDACGAASPPPAHWTMAAPASAAVELEPGWLEGGWLMYVPFESSGGFQSLGNFSGDPTVNAVVRRGVWGFANGGMSTPTPQAGLYSWNAPSLASPGVYMLCWCSGETLCDHRPERYKVVLGQLRLIGPTVWPSASQAFTCIWGRACELNALIGDVEPGNKLRVSSGPCGGLALPGMPQNGISLPSLDGSNYSWGSETISAAPGRHRLCWCEQNCFEPSDFLVFAGILRVKAPFSRPRRFLCSLGESDCRVTGIDGEDLSSGDRIMLMAACGAGEPSDSFEDGAISVETGPDGSWFLLPPTRAAGTDRVCWCAAESLCVEGRDFQFDVGYLVVGGPEAYAIYNCYDWQICEISSLIGTAPALSDGDRLWVVPPGGACGNGSSLRHSSGFPSEGMALPATDGGRRHSWGTTRIRAQAGMYLLCWCSRLSAPGGVCDETANYNIRAGVLKVGTAKQWMYDNRPPDPEPRSGDSSYLVAFAFVVPVAFVLACLFYRKVQTSRRAEATEPQAPNPFLQDRPVWQKQITRAKAEMGIKEIGVLRILKLAGPMKVEAAKKEDIPTFKAIADERSRSPKEMLEDLQPSGFDSPRAPSAIADRPTALDILPWEVPQESLPSPDTSPRSRNGASTEIAQTSADAAAARTGSPPHRSATRVMEKTLSSFGFGADPSSPKSIEDKAEAALRAKRFTQRLGRKTGTYARAASRFGGGFARRGQPTEIDSPRSFQSTRSGGEASPRDSGFRRSQPSPPPPEDDPPLPPEPAPAFMAIQDPRVRSIMELY